MKTETSNRLIKANDITFRHISPKNAKGNLHNIRQAKQTEIKYIKNLCKLPLEN